MRQPPLEEMRARFDSAEDERCLSVAAGLTLWRPGRLVRIPMKTTTESNSKPSAVPIQDRQSVRFKADTCSDSNPPSTN